MAKKDEPQRTMTEDLPLPPGNVVTPGYEVVEAVTRAGYSDRRIDATGAILDPATGVGEHLSTYAGPAPQTGLDAFRRPEDQTTPTVVEGAQS
jgi:hypothetical protein